MRAVLSIIIIALVVVFYASVRELQRAEKYHSQFVYTIEYTNARGETREYSAHTISQKANKITFIDATNNDEVTIPGNYILTKYKWDFE